MNDYKYQAQIRAEKYAQEMMHKDFFDLPDDIQSELYQKGLDQVVSELLDKADQ